jgi:hypothetical protein
MERAAQWNVVMYSFVRPTTPPPGVNLSEGRRACSSRGCLRPCCPASRANAWSWHRIKSRTSICLSETSSADSLGYNIAYSYRAIGSTNHIASNRFGMGRRVACSHFTWWFPFHMVVFKSGVGDSRRNKICRKIQILAYPQLTATERRREQQPMVEGGSARNRLTLPARAVQDGNDVGEQALLQRA